MVLGGLPEVYPGSSAQQRCKSSCRICAGTSVGRGKAIECLTLGLSRGMNGVTRSYCGAVFCIAKPKSPTVWAYLGVNPHHALLINVIYDDLII